MAKKKKAPAKNKRTGSVLKRALSKMDRDLAKLIQERASLFEKAVDSKVNYDLENMETILDKSNGPVDVDALSAIFREIQSASKSLMKNTKAAFLGPEFSYSHLAAIERFGQSCELIPTSTIASVFEAVATKEVDYGIVPIENSTDGRIVDTLDMFMHQPVRICGEIPINIHHNLLANCELSEITQVQSKPQATSQCRGWLAKFLPKANLVEASSTTAAAEIAATNKGVAAIASRQAGINYGLKLVAENIEDNKNNTTRFAVLGREIGAKTGNDKTSLMFELNHEPGALADAMQIFKRNRLNLTWIESLPKKGSKNEYIFFVELEGHQSETRVRKALASLEKKSTQISVLGSYQRKP